MFNLFSSFDCFVSPLMFFFEFMFLSFLFQFFFGKSLFNITFVYLKIFMFQFLSSLSYKAFSKAFPSLVVTLMFFIFLLNFSSNFGYVFAYTSQVSLVLFLSLSFWMSLMIYWLGNNLKMFLSHCIPEGTPSGLIPVLFFIEIISSLIRPVTLTVRLVANILSGHLLLVLLAKIVFFLPFSFFLFVFLSTVEVFVSLIQAYIFVTMVTLYYCDLC